MKELVLVLCVAILILTGCQSQQTATFSGVQVELINTDQFPKELVGHWVDDRHGWEFWLNDKGQLLGLVHTMARVRIVPGKVNSYKLIDEGNGRIEPGEMLVQYDGQTRELVIEVELDHYEWIKNNDVIEGNRKDAFIGNVSEDGMKWPVVWLSKEYITAETGTQEKRVLMQDEDIKEHGALTFTREAPPEE